ncbi:hypothetical protein CDD83_11109 [Cordyceps sp. RAO-2017]|nr:hypothetical protein CDD83_11109 [Cordyceps sp. RAO-2017]
MFRDWSKATDGLWEEAGWESHVYPPAVEGHPPRSETSSRDVAEPGRFPPREQAVEKALIRRFDRDQFLGWAVVPTSRWSLANSSIADLGIFEYGGRDNCPRFPQHRAEEALRSPSPISDT